MAVLPLLLTLVTAAYPAEDTVERIAERGRPSVVVVTAEGRDLRRGGLGTGFVLSADGLIATNLHVIGEGRAIRVEMADGSKHEVTAVHATDRANDLAIIRIAAKDLKPLELGDSDSLKDGQAIVALGNPQGLKHSVVGGVVSGRRTIEGQSLIQLAIPLEPGNSGGPLLDRQGRVRGIVNMKSAVTENLGFAIPINALKPLLAKPNPVVMAKWLTIGALEPDDWEPVFGGRWRQRAGRIQVEGTGQGFGGRMLCLSKHAPPAEPFEVAVAVKLADEAGAAGLAFHADGGDKHYGFYPSGGELRLTRFDGPDVFSWKILHQRPSPHYRPGEWNELKVRVEKGKLRCFVNGHLAVESDDSGFTEGRVGLAKFRDSRAEFKRFQVGKSLGAGPSAATVAEVRKAAAAATQTDPSAELLEKLTVAGGAEVLQEQARELEQQAVRLRKLAGDVHQARVRAQLVEVLAGPEDRIDLTHVALLIAALDNDELDVPAYRSEIDRMAKTVAAKLPKDADGPTRMAALVEFLFADRGFRGSRHEYYHRSNSYLNEVLDDREGLPIVLSVLYLELARRIGLKAEGVGLPGHFIVRVHPEKGEPKLIDVYDGATVLSRAAAEEKVRSTTGRPLRDEHLAAVGPKAIATRMLTNLLNLARDERDAEAMWRYVAAMAEVQPSEGPSRWMRAVLAYQTGRREIARTDVAWLLENEPDGVELREVRELKRVLDREP